MTTPTPGRLFHFTHISHLASIAESGLAADDVVQADGRLTIEVGNQEIKAARRSRTVPCGPGGCVADYVPFYFATRSPMLYAIHAGNVPSYQAGQADLVYLVSDVSKIVALDLPYVFTDRNATLAYARYSEDVTELDSLVDWQLMNQRFWNNTTTEPERRERRMAEFLVHGSVPWEAFLGVATIDGARSEQVREVLSSVGVTTEIHVRRGWYF